MSKKERLRVGDEVCWNEAPGQWRDNRPGRIVKIKRGIAYVDDVPYSYKVRQVPVKILRRIPVNPLRKVEK